MAAAAFFDLDRTVLSRSSGPAFARALRGVGVGPDRDSPLVDALYEVFDVVGETGPSMALARQAARMARGVRVSDMAAAAGAAVPPLLELVQPFVATELLAHRTAGRLVVLATTTPVDLVRPLADALGFDDVVATRYSRDGDVYDGGIDGHFTWGRGKLLAVREWADDAGVSVADSWAYSDSWYDAPLLGAVANPVAVNPDIRLAVLAGLRGWPVRHLDRPAGVPKVAGLELQELLRPLARAEALPFAGLTFDGLGNIPATGAAIVCFNHRSYFDAAVVGMAVHRAGRNARFLGKRELFDVPILGGLATALGGIAVDRGSGSDAPLDAAAACLGDGEVVVIAPQGTIPRGPDFFDPVLRGRWGAARLAADTGAPVVPLGLWGTERVWPRSARLPDVLNVVDPPPVSVTAGPPVVLAGDDLGADTDAVMAAIVDLLPDEARVRRQPTEAELARTYPRST